MYNIKTFLIQNIGIIYLKGSHRPKSARFLKKLVDFTFSLFIQKLADFEK